MIRQKVYIVMGVSGVGKTTIGRLLAKQLEIPFFDADDFHPKENVEKMDAGIPLKDVDRREWLENLALKITEWQGESGAVLACSALKEKYREQLKVLPQEDIRWIFLHSDYGVIHKRITGRKGHYFKPELLQSQYETLELPSYGIHIDVDQSPEQIINEIMEKMKEKAEIGLFGLGVMGQSLAINMASSGYKVSVYNRHVDKMEVDIAKNFVSKNVELNFEGFDDLKAFTQSLERPRNILLMVNAGKVIDFVIEDLLPYLDKDDLIIDGGNSHYKDTIRREKELKEKGILFMGVGISGGEEGARKGPSIMPGGPKSSYKRVGPILEKIAARDKNGDPCCAYIGPDGSGHFVKMVHNGIEYGEMQLIAETYHLLRFHTGTTSIEIAALFEEWNREVQSYLLEISIDILRKKEDGTFLLDNILDAAKQKGTGGWSTNAALELGVPLDTISAAVMARNISGMKESRTAAAKEYDSQILEKGNIKELRNALFEAFKASSIINHATGFDLLSRASKEYEWKLNLSEVARIWTNGCIIRSKLMEDLVKKFEVYQQHILMHPDIVQEISTSRKSLTAVVGEALNAGFPVPVMSAAANYLLSFTAEQSSANMIQAQRDYFGAHTYERKDKPRGEFFHTEWKPDRN
ncbi:NADP-dependent phosphogluconate dehydrogenase [Salinimicrobium sp. TH3]|uniref:NADP-dependent phosphogluconate dehydrogenase n=1 Tax=Salinimicrobium sp. TH3 TaxID=2997342 RepID=UPI002276B888|nr:NADP-dependent phosphogluconate dehydrogenase [Salinimicrobium sp. TH3]MCY2687075.1 NADP-dependent phosphogluconate dehydrogenase [Salinimicrobium sp. TH3]